MLRLTIFHPVIQTINTTTVLAYDEERKLLGVAIPALSA
jgi:hypothetical protein